MGLIIHQLTSWDFDREFAIHEIQYRSCGGCFVTSGKEKDAPCTGAINVSILTNLDSTTLHISNYDFRVY